MLIKRLFVVILVMSFVSEAALGQPVRSCKPRPTKGQTTPAEKSATAEPATTCARDIDLQDEILQDLYNDVFFHLKNAEIHLRSLANCFDRNPQMRPGQTQAMYTEFTSCEQIRKEIVKDLTDSSTVETDKWTKMRLNLALAEPASRSLSPAQVEQDSRLGFRINPNPQHKFKNVAEIAPLTPKEIQLTMDIWNANTKTFKEEFAEHSCFERDLDYYATSNSAVAIQFVREQDYKNEIAFLAQRREQSRAKHLETYTNTINALPLLAFLPRAIESPTLTDGDRENLRSSIYKLLFNNCVVRQYKFSANGESRSAAENKCQGIVDTLKRDSSGMSLDQQDEIFARANQTLNSGAPLKGLKSLFGREAYVRNSMLSVIDMYKPITESYKKRIATDKARVCQFEQLKSEYEQIDFVLATAEMGFYIALGMSCTLGLRRLPGITKVAAKFGLPLCLFATGLPINTLFWIKDNDTYMERYQEVFASAPYREMMQELKTLDDAQVAAILSTAFFGLGTGVPAVYKSGKLLHRFIRMKQRSSL